MGATATPARDESHSERDGSYLQLRSLNGELMVHAENYKRVRT